jgi:hypothetical protein
MTPREVDELTGAEYAAFWQYAEDEAREQAREARRARRQR